jgi:hypothetical protein
MINDNNKNKSLKGDKGVLLVVDSNNKLFLGRDNSISVDSIQEYIINISN